MTKIVPLTDRRALARHRDRARRLPGHVDALFLHQLAMEDLQERLDLVNKPFTTPVVVSPFPDVWRKFLPKGRHIVDDDTLDLQPDAHDLVIHAMALHWANDPVGQLIQLRRALRPDGLCLVILPGGRTLNELRSCLAEAETQVTGGLSPRVLPMAEIRDLGALMQRAGFALPVADSLVQTVEYRDLAALMADLRNMGETSALWSRPRYPARRDIFAKAATIYANSFGLSSGRLPATIELITLTGWAPHESQQQPLRPGSAKARLADALRVPEVPLKSG